MNSPKHVAIIMDGNGRWGLKKKNSRNYGHKKGLETVQKIINSAIDNKISSVQIKTISVEIKTPMLLIHLAMLNL